MSKHDLILKYINETKKGDFVGVYYLDEDTEGIELDIVPKRNFYSYLMYLKRTIGLGTSIYHIEGGDLHSITADYTAKMESYHFNHPRKGNTVEKIKFLEKLAKDYGIDTHKLDHFYDDEVVACTEEELIF